MAETDSQPFAENEQVKELLALLKDNNTPGYEEFAKLIEHVTGMEQRLSEATKELKAVRQEMQGLQNHSLKDALQKSCKAKDAYQDLAGYVEVPEQTASPEQATDPTETNDADIVLPSVDFEALRENGPDIIGWLSLPDTVLNYPVMQTDNNEYYLNHLYDGTYNKVGCLFADYENRADFSDRNTIIYAHNMRDGSMFALLNRYDEQSYFDTHRQMYLVTPKGGYVMEIFAAFAAKPEESGSETSPWQLSWKDDGAYTTWLTAMKERSAVESDVTVTCSDKVLTLSTCTPGGTGRFLVMGKLVKVDNEI